VAWEHFRANEPGSPPAIATVGYFTGLVGVVIAPSLGHWYAGERWTRGMTLRLAGLGTAALGGLAMIGACLPETCGGGVAVAGALAIGGGALFLAGTIHDLSYAGDAALKHNARRLMISPTPLRDGAGVAVAGTF
jgi:hypothetical protein